MEKELAKNIGEGVEVYRFGVSGAALSQHLQMLRHIKKKYNPDIAVIVIVHNDFLESVYGFGNPNGDFLQFRRENGTWVEVKPRPYVYIPDPKRMLFKKSSIIRYLWFNLNLNQSILFLKDKLKGEGIETNVKIDEAIKNLDEIKSLCHHIFTKYKEASGADTKLLLVIDANRQAIYEKKDPTAEKSYTLNIIANRAADELSIPFLDLTPVFISDYKNNRQRFDFKYDGHWNKRTHSLVAGIISIFILKHGWCE